MRSKRAEAAMLQVMASPCAREDGGTVEDRRHTRAQRVQLKDNHAEPHTHTGVRRMGGGGGSTSGAEDIVSNAHITTRKSRGKPADSTNRALAQRRSRQ
jgi:hypothetical protein